jgi:DNA-binding MarR family transcriptional regulator
MSDRPSARLARPPTGMHTTATNGRSPGLRLVDRLHAAAREAGAGDMRPSFGFVIRAVAAEQPTVGRLAELLGTTKQAASKLSDDMVQRGYLLREIDRQDRRRTRLRLSAKGRRVHARARAESAAIEGELRAELGDAAVDGLRRALLLFIEREGALAEAAAQRSRML